MDPAQINLPATGELALNTSKSISIVNNKVIGSRLGQGNSDIESHLSESRDSTCRCDVTLSLSRSHNATVPGRQDHLLTRAAFVFEMLCRN
jgi:hypothetical protein